MKKILSFVLLSGAVLLSANAQTCSSCGGLGAASSLGDHTGPSLTISLGALQYGQPAGSLSFARSLPDPQLLTPAALQLDAPLQSLIVVVTNDDGSLRQVNVPQALADIPVPSTTNGYAINFYYPSQLSGVVSNLYQFTGSPFATWLITNSNPASVNQLQISEFTSGSLLKQWTFTYATNPAAWTVQSLGGIEEVMSTTNLNSTTYQIANSLQYSNGPVAQRVVKTYQTFSWGVAPVQIAVGSNNAPEITTYTYYDPAPFSSGSATPVRTISNPDGSWQWYAGYDGQGNLTNVYTSFGDITLAYATNNAGGGARNTAYTYDPTAAGVSASGDDGSLNSIKPRRIIQFIGTTEISRQYTAYPSADKRLDVQCTVAGAAWGASGNLVTTNLFYTNGPNQFAPRAVISPDGTETTYNYFTNSTCQTNITVTGRPDATYTNIVDGVSNVIVLNLSGSMVSAASYDVLSGYALSADVYGNDDGYGRPQQVTHSDGTTEYMQYACCGLESSTDRDGVTTVYLYDYDKRAIGYEKIYNSGTSNAITWQNTLDAAGRTVLSYRVGADSSVATLNQSFFDPAGELVAQTNALNGVTIYTRTNDPTTGGLIRTTQNPDGGTITNFYYADGSLKKTVGTAVHGQAYGYGTGTDVNGNTCTYTTATNLDAGGNLTSERMKTYIDMAGRATEILYADGHYSQSFYNSKGQISKQVDPDGVTTLYTYNAKGEQAYTAIDLNQNGSIDFSGSDRITQTTNDVVSAHGTIVNRTRTFVWNQSGVDSSTPVSMSEASTNGLDTWQTQYRDGSVTVTNYTHVVPGVTRVVTSTAPDGSYTVSTNSYGRLASVTRFPSSGSKIGSTSYGYDAHGRQYQITDARNGTTTLGYNNADLMATNTTPTPTGGSAETTITAYNNMMQATSVAQPDGTTVSSIYLLTGELGEQYGSRIYPASYSFDYNGRQQTMTNWSGFSTLAGARVTTWNYDTQRGWLTSKTYDGGAAGPSYTYTGAGRLASRIWARGITTSYGYDNGGSLFNVVYSDGATSGVTNSYDRLGRLSSVSSGGMTDTLAYNLANELMGESFSGGILSGLAITNQYDQFLRRTNLTSLNGASALARAIYGYDAASRLSTVSDGTNNAAYTYLANSPLVSQILFKQSSTTRMTTTKAYDYLNRLTQVSSAPSSGLAATFNYTYNSANQRTHNTLADGSYWIYGYDALGQVTNACKYFSDGTPVAGQQFDYAFDTIGNRTQTQTGGNQSGVSLRVANYTNNSLNQIIGRDVPPYVDVMGASILTNVVTVNGTNAYRNQEYFRQQLSANNSSSALWTNIIVAGGQSVTGNVYVAKQPEVFKYDADGNMTNDGRFAYTWDGENRLISMTNNTSVGPQYNITFGYDYRGRRIQKIVATNSVSLSTNNFLYDGWNLIAETKPDNTRIRTYVWGSDLSGSMQGAGGIGGLLEVSYYNGSAITNCFPAFDGNGNVMTCINAADGTSVANYAYGPFGELVQKTGVMANNIPFRFSTKYQDDESDLLYYGYRYYKPSTGTWLSTDPMEEQGGANLYVFVRNYPIAKWDYLGKALEAGFVFSGSITYDLCQGSMDFTGWVWAGAGYELFDVFYGPSYSWEGSYTVTGLPHIQCGKCSCCSEKSQSGLNSSSAWNFVGPFFQNLGGSGNNGGGLIITPTPPCGANFEGIFFWDLLKSGAAGPIGTGLNLVARFMGAKASAGFEAHAEIHLCPSRPGEGVGGLTVDKAKIGGGAFVELGWVPPDKTHR